MVLARRGVAVGGEGLAFRVGLGALVEEPAPERGEVGFLRVAADFLPRHERPVALAVEGAPQVGALVHVGLHVDVDLDVRAANTDRSRSPEQGYPGAPGFGDAGRFAELGVDKLLDRRDALGAEAVTLAAGQHQRDVVARLELRQAQRPEPAGGALFVAGWVLGRGLGEREQQRRDILFDVHSVRQRPILPDDAAAARGALPEQEVRHGQPVAVDGVVAILARNPQWCPQPKAPNRHGLQRRGRVRARDSVVRDDHWHVPVGGAHQDVDVHLDRHPGYVPMERGPRDQVGAAAHQVKDALGGGVRGVGAGEEAAPAVAKRWLGRQLGEYRLLHRDALRHVRLGLLARRVVRELAPPAEPEAAPHKIRRPHACAILLLRRTHNGQYSTRCSGETGKVGVQTNAEA